jgi:uncharacterized protein YciI
MPQYVILAYDANDADAQERRMANRQAHIDAMTKARAQGQMLCGAALLDASGKMIGSNVVVNFASREALDAWLAAEPYVTGKVWKDISILPAKLGPTFEDLLNR